MSATSDTSSFDSSAMAGQPLPIPATSFVERRSSSTGGGVPVRERRQFTNSHSELSPEAAELAQAIDRYKMQHRRRFINYEEMLTVVKSLGYKR